MQWRTLIAVLALGPAAAGAAQLTDLRTRLAALGGNEAINATLDVTQHAHSDKSTTPAHVTLGIHDGDAGLELTFSPQLLQRAERESQAHAKNPDLPTPTRRLLDQVTPLEIGKLLHYSTWLSRTLENAKLTASRNDSLDGKSVQLLVFDVPGQLSTKDKDDISHFAAKLKVWLSEDGTPLACEQSYQYSGRKFFIGFKGSESESARLAVVGSRLVAVSRTRHDTFSGFGQDNDTSMTTALTLH